MNLKEQFILDMFSEENGSPIKGRDVLVTLVKVPPKNSIEVITNTMNICSKVEYIRDAYDEDFKLKSNPQVEIVGYTFY